MLAWQRSAPSPPAVCLDRANLCFQLGMALFTSARERGGVGGDGAKAEGGVQVPPENGGKTHEGTSAGDVGGLLAGEVDGLLSSAQRDMGVLFGADSLAVRRVTAARDKVQKVAGNREGGGGLQYGKSGVTEEDGAFGGEGGGCWLDGWGRENQGVGTTGEGGAGGGGMMEDGEQRGGCGDGLMAADIDESLEELD